MVAVSTRGNLPSLFEGLSESPVVSAFLDELKALATKVMKTHQKRR